MKRIMLLFVFLSLGVALSAQTFTFKVLGSSGLNEMKSGGSWSPIKVGAVLQERDEIKVAPNGVLGLYHASGKSLQVKEPGPHKVADLAAKVGTASSALSKYTDFILSSEQQKKDRLAATGAVHRGGPAKLTVFMPGRERADLLGDHFSVNWSSDGSSKFTVQITDLHGDVLKKYEVTGTGVTVNIKEIQSDEPILLVRVTSGLGASSEDSPVKLITGDRRATLTKDYQDYAQSLGGSDATAKILLANFFEEKLLLIDALTAYKEAADQEPMYTQNYKDFLARLGY